MTNILFNSPWWQKTTYPTEILIKGVPLPDLLSMLTFLVLFLTLYMSLKAIKEANRANILTALPILKFKYDFEASQISLENVGIGIAIDVRIDPFYHGAINDISNTKKPAISTLKFSPVNIIKSGETIILDSSPSRIDKFMNDKRLKFSMFNSAKAMFFNIRFKDLSGKRFISKIKVKQQSVEVVIFPRVFGIYQKIRFIISTIQDKIVLKFNKIKLNIKQKKLYKDTRK
jgi:hypothetical protein